MGLRPMSGGSRSAVHVMGADGATYKKIGGFKSSFGRFFCFEYGWGRYYEPPSLRRCMESDFEMLLFIICLVFFSIWLSFLTARIKNSLDLIEGTGDQIDEISEGIEIVAGILNRLPELMPSFHQHTSPLAPLIEMFTQKMGQGLKTEETQRGSDGRYIGETEWTEEER